MKKRFVFFGTDSFVVPVLSALVKLPAYECVGVITSPDRKGRGNKTIQSPVNIFAQELGLGVFTPEKLKDFFEVYTKDLRPNFAVIASYGKIISQKYIDATPHGIINIHPSLLPKYRGPSPVPATILAGDTKTGVTLMKIDAGVDSGDLLAKEEVHLKGSETTPELLSQLFIVGANMLQRVLPRYLDGTLSPVPQDNTEATYTKMFKKEDGKLNFNESADILERSIRALNPWPSTYSSLDDKTVKILQVETTNTLKKELAPGTIWVENNNFFVGTGTLPLKILLLQEEGKKPQKADTFLIGHDVSGKKFL